MQGPLIMTIRNTSNHMSISDTVFCILLLLFFFDKVIKINKSEKRVTQVYRKYTGHFVHDILFCINVNSLNRNSKTHF